MTWTKTTTDRRLRGLDAHYTDTLYLTGYDAEGLWLVRPEHDFARELIVKGTKDHTREGTSFFGATALAADANGKLYVAYDKGDYPKGEIGLAIRGDDKWKVSKLADQEAAIGETAERQIAIAVTAEGNVTVVAGVLTDERTLTVLRPGKPKHALDIDVDGAAATVDASGIVHLLCNPQSGPIRYGREVGGTWQLEDVTGAEGSPFLSIAIDQRGRPNIAFLKSGGKNALVYGIREDSGWRLTTVDRELNSGFNARLVFDPSGRVAIGHWASKSKYDAQSTMMVDTPVRYVRQLDTGWSAETVGEAFTWSTFALGPDGRPWFAFVGRDKKLAVASGKAAATPAVKPTKTSVAAKSAKRARKR